MKRFLPIRNLLTERLQVVSEGYKTFKKDGFEPACNEFLKDLIPEVEFSGVCSLVANLFDKVKGFVGDIDLGDILSDFVTSDLLGGI